MKSVMVSFLTIFLFYFILILDSVISTPLFDISALNDVEIEISHLFLTFPYHWCGNIINRCGNNISLNFLWGCRGGRF
jgi:uncharacterized membrane protein